MVPPQLAWTWIQRRQDEQTLSSQRQPAQAQAGAVPHPPHHPPPHPGHSRSPNRQLITAWRPGALAPLPLCSAKCVMEMGPKQTPLPRGTLAHSAEDGVQGARKWAETQG